jgi:putative SOS response-associated peptidase YedK
LAEKPAFRESFKKHRCLVLADGFFEWDKKSDKKVPYRITLKDKKPFAFAGICDSWKDENGKEIKSFSIITTKPNKLIEKIHDRMPVILNEEEEKQWLSAELETMRLEKLLDSYPAEEMEMQEISTLINNPKNDIAEALEPV